MCDFSFSMMLGLYVRLLHDIKPVDFCTMLEPYVIFVRCLACVFICYYVRPICSALSVIKPTCLFSLRRYACVFIFTVLGQRVLYCGLR
jgi:hypothetical protein